MKELLLFIANYFDFLFAPDQFQIVASDSSASFGDALIVVQSRELRIRFTRDRGQFLLELQPAGWSSDEWFSPGLVRGMLTGSRGDSEVLNPQWANYLRLALPHVSSLLAADSSKQATLDSLRQQAAIRSQELFG